MYVFHLLQLNANNSCINVSFDKCLQSREKVPVFTKTKSTKSPIYFKKLLALTNIGLLQHLTILYNFVAEAPNIKSQNLYRNSRNEKKW